MATTPFAYAAEKNGRCLGVTAGDYEVKRFYQDFVGCDIKAVATREDWDAYCKVVPFGPLKRRAALSQEGE